QTALRAPETAPAGRPVTPDRPTRSTNSPFPIPRPSPSPTLETGDLVQLPRGALQVATAHVVNDAAQERRGDGTPGEMPGQPNAEGHAGHAHGHGGPEPV